MTGGALRPAFSFLYQPRRRGYNTRVNKVEREMELPGGSRLQLVHGDITAEDVGAIVNAANRHLQHGGGVARTIVERGGPAIQRESREWVQDRGPVSHARPAWTSAGGLPAQYVIHAVGPQWGEGDEERKLALAVTGSLRVADALGVFSIAMPAISTGIFGYPPDQAATVILTAIRDYFRENPGSGLELVRVVLFDRPTLQAFTGVWDA